jgi:hypothetical protein
MATVSTNARERLTRAVGILVDEPGRVKDRLTTAYASQLSQIDRHADLSEHAASEFDLLRYALSDAEMPYGFGEHATKKIADMSEEEATQLAKRIFTLFLQSCDPHADHSF